MKKIVLSAMIVTMAVAAVQAQDLKTRRHKMERGRHVGMMAEKLNFSEEQKTKMKTINEDFRTQMTELKKNDNITVKEWKSRMETLRNDHKTKMQGLLTGDQKAQIEKMKTEHKAMHEVDAKARMEKMKIRLGLSDDQASKLRESRTAMGEKMKALREDKSLDKEKKKEQMKELMKQQKEKMKSILTEDQMKKLRERKGERPGKRRVI
jgi:hypothetical protein